MSDKYYLHDCNSYTHSCQNTYRIECKDVRHKSEILEETENEEQTARWWQRLRKLKRKTQVAKA